MKAVGVRRRRRAARVLAALAAAACGAVAAKWAWDWRSLRQYDPGVADEVRVEGREPQPGYVREYFSFQALPGERVPVWAAIPDGPSNRWPAVVFFYGSGMDMRFARHVDRMMTEAGFAFFLPEQVNRGRRRLAGASPLREALAWRRRVFVTGQEMRRLVDAVRRRPDVDPERVYFWGASFGAMACCRSVADEPRLKAAIFTLAGGDLGRMVRESPARDQVPRWARPLAWVAVWLLGPLDPVRTVGGVAPRPLLLQNTRADDLIPRASVEALYAAAGDPKTIAWYDMTHNHIQREGVAALLRDGLDWLRGVDRGAEPARAAGAGVLAPGPQAEAGERVAGKGGA